MFSPNEMYCNSQNTHGWFIAADKLILGITCSLFPSEVTWGIWLWILLIKSV